MNFFLVDDHQIFTDSLALMLQYQLGILPSNLATFHSPEDFLQMLRNNQAQINGIVFLDINFPKLLNGVDVCKEAKKYAPQLKIIALSMHHEQRYINNMIEAGASGYILKTEPFNNIKIALAEIKAGRKYFSPEVIQIIEKISLFTKLLDELNPKEKRILDGIRAGKTNQFMATEMKVSIKTIEYYRKSLFIKFGVSNAYELIDQLNLMRR